VYNSEDEVHASRPSSSSTWFVVDLAVDLRKLGSTLLKMTCNPLMPTVVIWDSYKASLTAMNLKLLCSIWLTR